MNTSVLTELCVLNAHARGTPENFGLRAVPVSAWSRDDRPILFAPPETISEHLSHCLTVWRAQIGAAKDPLDFAAACARFWMTFTAIHPFIDKNGETGRRFLARELESRGVRIATFHFLDRCLIEGAPEDDLRRLTVVFLLTLDLESPAFQRRKNEES